MAIVVASVILANLSATVVADCTGNLCANNAACVDLGSSGYKCNCTRAWVGTFCNITAGCDAAPFNMITAPSTPDAVIRNTAYGGTLIIASGSRTFALQMIDPPTNSRGYVVASHRTPSTDSFNTQTFEFRFPNSTANWGFSATDTFLAIIDATTHVSTWFYDSNASTWRFVTSYPPPNTRLTAVAVNDDWFLLHSSPISGNPTMQFYKRTGSDPSQLLTVTQTVQQLFGAPASYTMALGPTGCSVGQFAVVSFDGFSPTFAFVYYYNATTLQWNITQTLRYTGFVPAMVSMSCDTIVASNPSASNTIVYTYNGTQWTDPPQQLSIPNPISGEQCGKSVKVDGITMVIGCPYGSVANADTGRVIQYKRAANTTWLFDRVFTDYCSSTFQNGTNSQFGAGVALQNGGLQVVVGVPGYNNSAGGLLQFGQPCSANAEPCLSGNTCVQSPYSPSTQQCVCTVDSAPCTTRVVSSSSSSSSTGTVNTTTTSSSSTGHSHSNNALSTKASQTLLASCAAAAFAFLVLFVLS